MAETGAGRSEQQQGVCWCLRRRGGSRDVLLLPEGEEVSLGRGLSVTYQLVSPMYPLMISRKHCIFKQNTEGQWTVTDLKSLNGVSLNSVQLEPLKPYVLTLGSCVRVGVVPPNEEDAEFEYDLVQENLEQIQLLQSEKKRRTSRSKRKINCEDSEASGTEGTSSKAKVHRGLRDDSESAKVLKSELSKQLTVKVEDAAELDSASDIYLVASTQTPSESTLHLTKMRQSIVELRTLNAQVQQKLKTPHQSSSAGGDQPLSSQQELQDLQKELSSKHEEHLQRVDELKKIFQEGQGNQESSSQAGEERVKEQLAQALREHALLMEDLNRSHQDFEQILEAKNKELQETKKEKEKVEAQKEAVLSHMNDVLDNELQCIICSEHFIEAVTLNCAHSFCSFCIESWRRRKEECPICRQAITSQTRSLVLDNCIDRMVDKLSLEMKDRRMALILQRKDLAAEPIPVLDPSDSDVSPLASDYSMSGSDDEDSLLHEGEDLLSDSEDFHSFSEEEFDSDDGGLPPSDYHEDLYPYDDYDDDYDYDDDDEEDDDNFLFLFM